jgi:hypothetical protein
VLAFRVLVVQGSARRSSANAARDERAPGRQRDVRSAVHATAEGVPSARIRREAPAPAFDFVLALEFVFEFCFLF